MTVTKKDLRFCAASNRHDCIGYPSTRRFLGTVSHWTVVYDKASCSSVGQSATTHKPCDRTFECPNPWDGNVLESDDETVSNNRCCAGGELPT